MIGSGMPWHIIMSFFAIGIVAGLISAKMARQKTNK